MGRWCLLCGWVIVPSVFFGAHAHGATILIVSDAPSSEPLLPWQFGDPYPQTWPNNNDDPLVDLLRDLGHTVDNRGMWIDRTKTGGEFQGFAGPTDLATYLAASPADLVIVTRTTGAAQYDDNAIGWNELDVPLLLMNGLLPRGAQWGWTTGNTTDAATETQITVVEPAHSFLDGVDAPTPDGSVPIYSSASLAIHTATDPYVTGAVVVAEKSNGAPIIVDIPAGTAFGGAGDKGTSTQRRVLFAHENSLTPGPGELFDRDITLGPSDSYSAVLAQIVASLTASQEPGGGNDGGGGSTNGTPEPSTLLLALFALGIAASRRRAFGQTHSPRASA